MHNRIAAWYLHRSRSHWVLWIRHYDDNWGKWDWDTVSVVPLRQASEEEAATHLLMDAWERESREMSTDRFHWINEVSLLSIAQVFLLTSYRRLPVVENGRLLGQVSRRDVLRASMDLLRHSPDRGSESSLLYLSALVERHEAPLG